MSEIIIFFSALIGLIIFAFLLYCIISAINDGNHSQRDRKEENKSSPTNNKIHYTVYYNPAFAIQDAIDAYRRDRKSESRENYRREKYSLVVAAFTALFGLSAVGAAIYSATLAIDQNNISRTALVAVQRAFVNLSSIETKWKVVPEERGKVKYFIFQPVITNDGNTATVRLRYIQGASGVTFPSPQSPSGQILFTEHFIQSAGTIITAPIAFAPPKGDNHPNDPESLFSNRDAALRLPLGPKGKYVANIIGFPEDEMKQAMEAGWYFYVYGAIKYFDVFPGKKEHITKFCYRFERDITSEEFSVINTPCQNWNCIDDECADDKKSYYDRMAKSK